MAKKILSYLDNLTFDKKLLLTFHARYLVNIRLVTLLLLTIITVGGISLLSIPRRLNPEVKLTIVSVSTILPGAGPKDVESLITIPLEDKLSGTQGLDTMSSVSQDGNSFITLQFKSGTDKDKARNDVQTAVSEVTDLPSDSQIPKVTALDFENSPIWTFSLVTGSDIASLMRYAKNLKDDIEKLPNIDHVALSGFDTQQIQIIFDQSKINQYSVNPLSLSGVIKSFTKSFPAGSIYTDRSSFSLAIDAQATSVDQIRNITIVINGQPVRLGDIASVSQRSTPNQLKTFIADNKTGARRSVTFAVFKSSSADIDKTVASVESFVRKKIDASSGKFAIVNVLNTGEQITKQFSNLLGEFQSTLFLVFINLLLFLGLRQAFIAILTVPLTFLLSFTWMNLMGQSINFISLFALLLAFGTSIDDTIVTVSAMTSYYRTGKFSPHQTGILVWRDFIVPIWTTTVTTVWAFLPLILTSGIIGEFIKPIPLVVASTMYTSTAIAWFITLPLMIVFLKPKINERVQKFIKLTGMILSVLFIILLLPGNILLIPAILVYVLLILVSRRELPELKKVFARGNKHQILSSFSGFLRSFLSKGIINTEFLSNKYKKIIIRILSSDRARRVTLICLTSFAVFAYLLIPLGLVRNEFFPKTNSDTFYISLDLPAGTNSVQVENESKTLLENLRKTPETTAVITEIGRQLTANFTEGVNPSSSLFTIILTPMEKRKTESSVIAEQLRKKLSMYNRGKISVVEISGGPPAGAEVQIKFLGDDLNFLEGYADKTLNYLSKQPGIINADKSVKSGTSKLTFIPDTNRLSQNGLSIDTIGFWLRLSSSGFTLDSVKFNNQNEDIVFYLNNGTFRSEDLASVSVPTQNGSVPLLSLGHVELENNPTVITREGGKRTISVFASVLPGYSVSAANKNLENFASEKLSLQSGYEWKTGGVNEENQKSVNSIFQAMGLSFLLIMATMVIEFGSYRQAAMILSLIPFAVSGVFIIFGLSGTPLSFPALIGVMALFGVVVTNAMFIVEKINQNRKEGMDLDHAIADAGQGRLEPIMLTSLTSILGLIPITLANPLWRGLGGAIISGLMFSGIIMLLYIPVMYYTLFRNDR